LFQVYPSSFSIAALIGAAAIRERVATKLRWKEPEEIRLEENEDADVRHVENMHRRRRHSNDSDGELELKKIKQHGVISAFKSENLVTEQPKNEAFVHNEPIIEQIKLAKRLLRDPKELLKPPESKGEYDSEDDISEADMKPYLATILPCHQPQPTTEPSNGKQCMVQSNSKMLEKVG
jgi:hypothetical protein